ncbi:MAG: TolB family protein, partial [Thermoguttaceae bacterium]
MFVSVRRYYAFFIAVLLVASASVFCRADEQEWSFDSKQFEARLFQDWLAQDVSDPALRGVIFTDAADFDAQRECVSKVLASLSDDPSEDEFDDALPYDVATGAEGEVPREKDVDPSSEGVEKLNVRFNALVAEKVKCGDPQWRDLYRDACLARRARRLASAVEYAPKIVYTKHYVIGASHYAYTEDVTDEAYLDFSCDRSPGGQLCLATFAPDGTIRNEVLVESKKGTIRDPDVSWDGKRILFSMRNSYDRDDFHIYEYDLETEKTRQITFGHGVADIEPIYLPDDNILFGSTRCGQITDCWWT